MVRSVFLWYSVRGLLVGNWGKRRGLGGSGYISKSLIIELVPFSQAGRQSGGGNLAGSGTINALATADPFHMDDVGISDKWSENGVLST